MPKLHFTVSNSTLLIVAGREMTPVASAQISETGTVGLFSDTWDKSGRTVMSTLGRSLERKGFVGNDGTVTPNDFARFLGSVGCQMCQVDPRDGNLKFAERLHNTGTVYCIPNIPSVFVEIKKGDEDEDLARRMLVKAATAVLQTKGDDRIKKVMSWLVGDQPVEQKTATAVEEKLSLESWKKGAQRAYNKAREEYLAERLASKAKKKEEAAEAEDDEEAEEI